MTTSPVASDSILNNLIDELTAKLQAGEPVDLDAVIANNPDHAESLRRLLPALQVLADLSNSCEPGALAPGELSAELGELGDFRLIREVGRGGMGIVYEAEQISLRRRVALKVLPWAAAMDPKQLQRFKNEALAAASLKHDHIVSVYAVGCERGVHFYAMEFVEGQTLAQLITASRERERPEDLTADFPPVADAPGPRAADTAPIAALSTERSGPRGRKFYRHAAELIADAADALEHAHALGIVHRDIKPGNFLLDANGRIYVSDFGLARFGPDAGLTISGEMIGTWRYMSPEQALARHGLVDHRADIYSLGATLYELLTLQAAVRGDDKGEILRAVAWEEPTPPRKLDKSIPVELETITLKCLAKNPNERYSTAGELAEDLRRWLGDVAIKAKPPSVAYRLRKYVRRNRAAMGMALVLGIAVLIVAGSVGWSMLNVAARRAGAEQAATLALDESADHHRADRPDAAMASAVRAVDTLAGVRGAESLLAVANQRVADLAMAVRLEDLWLSAINDGKFNSSETIIAALHTAFSEYGIDLVMLTEAEASERIRTRLINAELVGGLDSWAAYQRILSGGPDALAAKLRAIAAAADLDPWSRRVREVNQIESPDQMVALATELPVETVSAAVVRRLALHLNKIRRPTLAESLARRAIRFHPDNLGLNIFLGDQIEKSQSESTRREALEFYRAALAVRPRSPALRSRIGGLLTDHLSQPEDGAEWFRDALRLKPDYHIARMNLSIALGKQRRYAEAVFAAREVVAAVPNVLTYSNLAHQLAASGSRAESDDALREALRFEAHTAQDYLSRASALNNLGRSGESIVAYREAIRLEPENNDYHVNLGILLARANKSEEAVLEFRDAIRLGTIDARAYYNLGLELLKLGRPDEAEAAYRKAIEFAPEYAEAHCNLGQLFFRAGRFADALPHFQRGHVLGSSRPGWSYPSARWVENSRRLSALGPRLPEIIAGTEVPSDPRDAAAIACTAALQDLTVRAAELYRSAILAEPLVANDLKYGLRYSGACAAARTGCGQGKGADKLDNSAREAWRRQALVWLRADLTAWQQLFAGGALANRRVVQTKLSNWQREGDLESVRSISALAKLPPAERDEWQSLWTEVRDTLEMARAPIANKP